MGHPGPMTEPTATRGEGQGSGSSRGNATVPTGASVADFIAAVPNPTRRQDAERLVALFQEVTGQPPEMWGPSIVGFGRYTYYYASGRSGEWPAAGFSPRAAALTVYLMDGLAGREDMLARLGPHTTGKGCLYVKRLDQVDLDALADLVRASYSAVSGGEPGHEPD